jgi:5S rRNA maturation endonuclease (ribonuclease M5)
MAFYHEQLLANQAAMDYLLSIRKRTPATIETMNIGLGGNLVALYEKLRAEGIQLNDDDWNNFVVGSDLVYPYIDPDSGEIPHLNTKAIPDPTYPDKPRHGFSVGKRTLYRSTKLNHDMATVVESENDLMALLEQGAESVVALGGKPSDDIIKELAEFNCLYLMLDNDVAGETMTKELNDKLPHIPVFQIVYDSAFKDPDEYYRECPDAKPIQELVDNAILLETDGHRMTYEGDKWVFATRKLSFQKRLRPPSSCICGGTVHRAWGEIFSRVP